MTDTNNKAKAITGLPVATDVAKEDVFVMVDESSGNTKQVTFSLMIKSSVYGPFDDDGDAEAGGVELDELYYTSNGVVHIRLS